MRVIETKKPTAPQAPHPFFQRHRMVVTLGFPLLLVAATLVLTIINLKPIQRLIAPNLSKQNNPAPDFLASKPSTWPSYQTPSGKLSFRYPTNWSVTTKDLEGETLITLLSNSSPEGKFLIFISPKSFLGFDGLKTETQDLNGYKVTSVDDLLFGIKQKNLFYTFDASASPTTKELFRELANTIKID